MQDYSSIADNVIQIARQAGNIVMQYFHQGYTIDTKQDDSPITQADIASSRFIEKELAALTPDFPVISEESIIQQKGGETFWLVDPLDGTRAFIKGKPEFAVSIGLIHQSRAVFGVLFVPPTAVTYVGGHGVIAQKIHADGSRHKIKTEAAPKDGWRLIKSASHASDKLNEFLAPYPIGPSTGMSSAIKFGILAEGAADIYPRLGRTMEWDTAAGQAIVEAAGGVMQTLDGKAFLYGKEGYINPGFVAFGQQPMQG